MKNHACLMMLLAAPAIGAPEIVRFDTTSMPSEPWVNTWRLSDYEPLAPDIELSYFAHDPGGGSDASYWHPQIVGFGWDPFGMVGLEVESLIIDQQYLQSGVVVSAASPGSWGVAHQDVYYGAPPSNYSLQSISSTIFPFQDSCLKCSYMWDLYTIDEGVYYIAIRWEQDAQSYFGWVAFEVEYLPYTEDCLYDDDFSSCDGDELETFQLLGLRYIGAGYETEPNTPIVVGGGLCRTDMNFDAVIDFFDVSAFVSRFAAGDSSADYTGDGSFDFFDVSAFISEYIVGCAF